MGKKQRQSTHPTTTNTAAASAQAATASTPATAPPSAQHRQVWWLAAIIALVGIVLYIQTLQYGYVLDDYSVIKKNWLTQRGAVSIPEIFTTHYRYGFWNKGSELYRPIPLSMFAIEWQLAPDQPWLSHLVNVLLHALLGVVTFITLRRWFQHYHIWLPFVATLLFIAHPLHTEVVANIKSRDEILAMLFCMAACHTLLQYWDFRQLKYLVYSLLWFTVALFSKENSVTFLAIFPLLTYYFAATRLGETIKVCALFLAPTILYFAVRSSILGDWDGDNQVPVLSNLLSGAESTGDRLATAFKIMGIYLWRLLVPAKLVSDMGYNEITITSWSDWRAVVPFVIYTAAGVWALFNLRRRNIFAFALAFFFITFSIFSNVIYLIGSSYGERFLFIPSLGLTLLIAAATHRMLRLHEAHNQPLTPSFLVSHINAVAPLLLLLAFYSYKTVVRNPDWKSGYALFSKDSEQSPQSAMLKYHYGLELVDKWKETENPTEKAEWLQKAKQAFEAALKIFPMYHHAYGELGLIHYRVGQKDMAMDNYRNSVSYDPTNATVFSNMGTIFYERNQRDSAEIYYKKAISLDNKLVDAHRNLGTVFATSGRWQEAINSFSEALLYEPNDATLNFYLGSAYRDSGNPAAGQPYLEKAYQLQPSLRK